MSRLALGGLAQAIPHSLLAGSMSDETSWYGLSISKTTAGFESILTSKNVIRVTVRLSFFLQKCETRNCCTWLSAGGLGARFKRIALAPLLRWPRSCCVLLAPLASSFSVFVVLISREERVPLAGSPHIAALGGSPRPNAAQTACTRLCAAGLLV